MLRKTMLISMLITSTLLFYVSCNTNSKAPSVFSNSTPAQTSK